MSFGEVALKFWVKTCVRGCAKLQEAEGKELHGSSTRTVQEACKSFLPHTGQLHGPCPSFSSARVFNTGRVREACALIFGVARGVLLNTDRAERVLHGSRLALHGACQAVLRFSTGRANPHRSLVLHGSSSIQHESNLFLHGSCNFSSSEVGTLNFSQYSGFIMI